MPKFNKNLKIVKYVLVGLQLSTLILVLFLSSRFNFVSQLKENFDLFRKDLNINPFFVENNFILRSNFNSELIISIILLISIVVLMTPVVFYVLKVFVSYFLCAVVKEHKKEEVKKEIPSENYSDVYLKHEKFLC